MMKNKLLLLVSFVMFFSLWTSCVFNFEGSIQGNGNVVTETRNAQPFERLDVSAGIDVIIKFGEEPSVVVEADENLMEVIRTDFDDGCLRITSDRIIRKAESKKVRLTVPELHSIEISSAAHVRSENLLKTDELDIEVSSAGEADLKIETREVDFELSSAAKVSVEGRTGELNAEVSSAGSLDAYDLISEECNASVSSAGSVKLNVVEKLKAEASSAGSISYIGDPEDTKIERSSAGSVRKR